ncbi:GAF domain-containing protein [Hymenobacter terricola]|uniref:GAF domain-containing protein n=1 Tax=Hymenobacter terricola TaxID=2819236 RepID=UPI001B3121EB|nr:GAF domain-containing protein [Hymenobacter terricola]
MDSTLYPGLIPSYEHERLAALQPYQVLGTPGQGPFNDFVSIVAKLLDVPIALISLVRDDDVVFIGNTGLPEASVVDREDSMCSVAILNDGLTVFEDIATQPCALVNPFVAQKMHLGFYAGQALRAPNGMALGSLCVMDRAARQLSPAEGELLTQLALVAQDLLALQAANATEPIPALQARLEGLVQQSLTRLHTLAELHTLDLAPDEADAGRYTASRLDEASYLAQALHRELLAVLDK